MDYFAETYDYTTNPATSYTDALKKAIPSILFHALIYTIVGKFLMRLKILPNIANNDIFLSMIVIMTLGYYCRLNRSKSLSKVYDRETAKHMMDNAYMCWYFLG